MKRKEKKTYYFSVEGETEMWYLNWLQSKINEKLRKTNTEEVSLKPLKKDPLKLAKSLPILFDTTIYRISDYESDEKVHAEQFFKIMDRMKEAEDIGKQITYEFGYSNFNFELWIVLHKADCNNTLNHRDDYIKLINKAYNETFENAKKYKNEANFKRVLSKLELSNVMDAVKRSKRIMRRCKENGYKLLEYKGYRYYKENPSLMVGEIIEKILIDCNLIKDNI